MEYEQDNRMEYGQGGSVEEQKADVVPEIDSGREGRKTFGRIGFAFAIFMGVTIAAQAGFSALFYLGAIPPQFATANTSVLISMAAMYLVAFPVFWWLMKQIPVVEHAERQKWSFGSLAVTFLICMAAIYIGNIIGQLLMFLVSLITGEPMVNNLQVLILNMDIPVLFLFTVIVAPVMEEMMYRKLLIDRIRQYGEGLAVVISGILFGLAHGNFYQFFYAFALGAIFAYIYIRSGNIRYTMIFHMIINFLGGIFPTLLLRLMKTQLIIGSMLTVTFGLFVIGFLVVGTTLFIMNRKNIVLYPGSRNIPKGKRFRSSVVNVGMILYGIICLVMFAMG